MSKNVLITGANRGIGLALSQQYLNGGNSVYAVCRKASDELKALEGINIIDQVDVTSDTDLTRLATQLGNTKLDIVINNAGILADESLGSIDFASLERQFLVNAVGPVKTTQALLQNLNDGAKIALVTSRMGSVSDNGSGGYYGYRMSKAALNAAGKSLSIDLKPKNIAVCLLHPGFVQTDMVGHQGDVTPATAAQRLSQRITELTLQNSGSFWHANGETLPW